MLADEMIKIHEEDQYNDCYGRERMYLERLPGKLTLTFPVKLLYARSANMFDLSFTPLSKT